MGLSPFFVDGITFELEAFSAISDHFMDRGNILAS
jgi:hypothetical protein